MKRQTTQFFGLRLLRSHSCGLLLLIPLLASCGPSPGEIRARKIVEPSVVSIFKKLPHPTPITTKSSNITVGGSYHALEAEIHAKYRTNVPAKQVCENFLQVLNQELGFDTSRLGPGVCLPTTYEKRSPYEKRVSYGINGEKDNRHIWVSFSAADQTYGDNQLTEISIWLVHTLDKDKWGECVSDEAGRVKSYCDSSWGRSLELPTATNSTTNIAK
jgi:hypothetical protein